MGHALKIIKFDPDDEDKAIVEEEKVNSRSRARFSQLLVTLKYSAILTAILGVTSLVLEVQYYFQFRYEIYIARLVPTLLSFITLLFIQSEVGRKYKILLTHTFLITIISSVSYVIAKIPSIFLYNAIALSLFVLTLSLFFLWEVKNQIILSLYLFAALLVSSYYANLLNFNDGNTFVAISSLLSILTIGIIASYLQLKKTGRLNNNIISSPDSNEENSYGGNDLNEFISSSSIAFFQLHKDGEIKYSNHSFNEIFGIKSGVNISEINFFEQFVKNENVKNHIIKKIENKGRLENYRINISNQNGKSLVLLMDCKLNTSNSEEDYLEGSVRDITSQIEKEKALSKELDGLKKIKRNPHNLLDNVVRDYPKKNLISKMGHELRTPMNSVLGFLTLIENGLFESEEELKDFSHSAKLSAESLLNLMNDIVEISKIQDGTVSIVDFEFNIREEIEKVISVLTPAAKQKSMSINCDISENIPDSIISDPSKYAQILSNLINNSIEASEGGEIKIFVSEEKDSNGRNQLVTAIDDYNSSLSKDLLKKVFNNSKEIEDSDSKVSTNVLHLMICKELTSLLDGSIRYEEKDGLGIKFIYKIPVGYLSEEEENTNDVDNSVEGVTNNVSFEIRPKLLLVEDNPISRKVEKKLLEESGYSVDCIDNGYDAIEKIKEGKYNLVLMDIELKEMDGLEATKKIRELSDDFNKIPIIAVTAHSSMKDREKCLLAGMNDYISKPININFLKMTIDQWLNAARAK